MREGQCRPLTSAWGSGPLFPSPYTLTSAWRSGPSFPSPHTPPCVLLLLVLPPMLLLTWPATLGVRGGHSLRMAYSGSRPSLRRESKKWKAVLPALGSFQVVPGVGSWLWTRQEVWRVVL